MRLAQSRSLPFLALVVVACVVPVKAEGQSIAQRVRSAPDGKVRFTFAPKPGVCGLGPSISRSGDVRYNMGSSRDTQDVDYDTECSSSPVRVVLSVDNGRVTKVRTYVGGRWRAASSVTDLGHLSTKQATDYLLGIAAGEDGPVARDAILPALLADSVVVWPALARLARDETRPQAARKQALFWLGQEAGDRIAGPDRGKYDTDTEIRKQAVFALSQQRTTEAVPTLIEVARRNRDPEVRRSAIFWLGQRLDRRVIDLFEQILRG